MVDTGTSCKTTARHGRLMTSNQRQQNDKPHTKRLSKVLLAKFTPLWLLYKNTQCRKMNFVVISIVG
jgi:hypothetical protein